MKKNIYVAMLVLLPLFAWAGTPENSKESVQPEVSITPTASGPMWINTLGEPMFKGDRLYTIIAENGGDHFVWEMSGDATIERVNRFDANGNPVEIAIRTPRMCNGVGEFILKLKRISSGIVDQEVSLTGRVIRGLHPCP